MIPPVYPILSVDAGVLALIGAPGQILRKLAPQNTPRPYIVWRVVASVPENYISDATTADQFRLSIEVVADTDVKCRAVAKAVQTALGPHATEIGVVLDEEDAETGLHRYVFDWSFLTLRT